MENEVASKLTTQPNYQARVRTLTGEWSIQTLPPSPGLSGSEFTVRLEKVREQTRAIYCRPRADVEMEIAERQAALMETEEAEEKVQGRHVAEPEAGQGNGKAPFKPSRRHKTPPQNQP
jgi:hypothetical protein